MAAPVLNEKLTFNLISRLLIIEDITDWAAGGVTLGTDGVDLYLKVELINDSTTVLYDNLAGPSPDIIPNTSRLNINDIDIPVDSDGNPIFGDYKITVRASIIISLARTEITSTFTYAYGFTLPELCLTEQVNCFSATVTGRDITDYGVYMTSITRIHSLYPPPNKAAVQSGTQAIFIYNGGTFQMWTGKWIHEVNSTVNFIIASGAYVLAQIDGSKPFDVQCDTTLCKIRCCLQKLGRRWLNATKTNQKLANEILNTQITLVQWYVQEFGMARDCGNEDDMACALAAIKEISGCKGNCAGCTDEPQLIVPLTGGGSGSVIVDSPNGSVAVTPEIIGTTTYYHLEVAAWIITIINNLVPVNVVSGDSIIQVVPSVVSGVRTFTITYLGVPVVAENHIEIQGKIAPTPSGPAPWVFTPTWVYNNGADVAPTGSQTFKLGQTSPNVSGDFMILQVKDFLLSTITPKRAFTASANMMSVEDGFNPSAVNDIDCKVIYADLITPKDDFTIEFFNPANNNTPLRLDDVKNKGNIFIKIQIYIKAS